MIYQFKQGAHLNGDAQAVGEKLAALESVGRLTPEAVLHDARKATSPLHPFFEWDDAKAAKQHRLAQAGHLIRCVTVVLEEQQEQEQPRTIRAFLPIEAVDESRSYVPTLKALGDADMRKQVLAQAHSELGAVARKYRELKELSEVVSAIDRVGRLLESSEGQSH
jgi:hypothetical protein